MAKVGITGMGIISAIGDSVEENFLSLRSAQPGITRLENFSSVHAQEIFVGES
jgi:3-oxoacyl-[acyl-carrier-protein] synthase II